MGINTIKLFTDCYRLLFSLLRENMTTNLNLIYKGNSVAIFHLTQNKKVKYYSLKSTIFYSGKIKKSKIEIG